MFRISNIRYSNVNHLIHESFIRNIQYPSCLTCKNFVITFPKELHHEKKSRLQFSQCKKFGYKDLISGDILYETAEKSRSDKNMCRVEGIHYKDACD